MNETKDLVTARLRLVVPMESMAGQVAEYFNRNSEHFAASSPRFSGEFTDSHCLENIRAGQKDAIDGRSFRLYLTNSDPHADRIIGDISFTNIVGGVFQACHLGYRIDQDYEGQGLMREALACAISHAWENLSLHRIMANYVPTNERSGRLLRHLGFSVEGYARDYLKLNGEWQDHILTALIAKG